LCSNVCRCYLCCSPIVVLPSTAVAEGSVSGALLCSGASVCGSCVLDLDPPPLVSDMTKCYEAWESFLVNDSDKEYLLNGVHNGFRLLESDIDIKSCNCKNYRSATCTNHEQMEKQIQLEIDKGRYVIMSKAPLVVSTMGTIPKKNNAIRLIHDMSRPDGGVNG
jgi:hypothetical protein